MKAKPVVKKAATPARRRDQAIIAIVPGGKNSRSKLNKLGRDPELLDDDEADYRYSMAAIREGGKDIPLSTVLKRYGRR